MGLGNLFKSATDKTTELIRNEVDKRNELKQIQQEQQNMTKTFLYIKSGFQLIHVTSQATMFQRADGTIYFNNNVNDSYTLIDYEWNGPIYNTVQSGVATTNGTEVTKGKAGKMTAGAAIGTALMPGVGTVVGAAIGAGGKKKKSIQSVTRTNTIQRQTEVATPATLTFVNNITGEKFGIVIACNSLIDSQLKCFNMQNNNSEYIISQNVPESSSVQDPYEEIKKAKELLDMGIISQDEFDNKKKELLNL